MIQEIFFFLEEPSAEAMLKVLIPRILPPEHFKCSFRVFRGKQDLEKNLPLKLRAWRNRAAWLVVLRDQDACDCRQLKQRLKLICTDAGHPSTLIRIACHELESFYLGDLSAVEKGLGLKGIAKLQGKEKYRDPDALRYPARDLDRLTAGKYQKLSGSRAIAPHLDLHQNTSTSFKALIQGIRKIG